MQFLFQIKNVALLVKLPLIFFQMNTKTSIAALNKRAVEYFTIFFNCSTQIETFLIIVSC